MIKVYRRKNIKRKYKTKQKVIDYKEYSFENFESKYFETNIFLKILMNIFKNTKVSLFQERNIIYSTYFLSVERIQDYFKVNILFLNRNLYFSSQILILGKNLVLFKFRFFKW